MTALNSLAAKRQTSRSAAPDGVAAKQRLIDFVEEFSIETTPGESARTTSYRDHLEPGVTVYVAFRLGAASSAA